MKSPPLRVDALVAYSLGCKSRPKLRRFRPPGKADPGEYAAVAAASPERRSKLDKYKSQPVALALCPVADDRYDAKRLTGRPDGLVRMRAKRDNRDGEDKMSKSMRYLAATALVAAGIAASAGVASAMPIAGGLALANCASLPVE